MRYKLFFILILSLTILQQVSAETIVVVQKKNGAKETFLISDEPEITMKNYFCTISAGIITINIPREDISDIHFEEKSSGVSSVKEDCVCVRFINDYTLELQNFGDDKVSIYDIDGRAVDFKMSKSNNILTVALDNLPQGIYIIKYGSNSIKLSRK